MNCRKSTEIATKVQLYRSPQFASLPPSKLPSGVCAWFAGRIAPTHSLIHSLRVAGSTSRRRRQSRINPQASFARGSSVYIPPRCRRALGTVAGHFCRVHPETLIAARGRVVEIGCTIRFATLKRLAADLLSAQRPAWCRFDIADTYTTRRHASQRFADMTQNIVQRGKNGQLQVCVHRCRHAKRLLLAGRMTASARRRDPRIRLANPCQRSVTNAARALAARPSRASGSATIPRAG